MAKSPAFARIKQDVLQITKAIPAGRVTTFKAIGQHLDVMPRHVAYILTMLTPAEKDDLPWFRVVADNGKLGKTKRNGLGESQADLLKAEGLDLVKAQCIDNFDTVFIKIDSLNSGVPKQTRPT
ncbi:MAG: MGMT family protein [Cyanobacteria bacterium J06635_1]